jgi:hypothetical protein
MILKQQVYEALRKCHEEDEDITFDKIYSVNQIGCNLDCPCANTVIITTLEELEENNHVASFGVNDIFWWICDGGTYKG